MRHGARDKLYALLLGLKMEKAIEQVADARVAIHRLLEAERFPSLRDVINFDRTSLSILPSRNAHYDMTHT